MMMKFYDGLMINEGAIVLLLQGMTFITILQRLCTYITIITLYIHITVGGRL